MKINSLLKFVVAFGLLAILLAFLGVNYVPRISASSSTSVNLVDASIQARQNYVNERYPRSLAPQLSTTGSDYFERHASMLTKSDTTATSDYFERQASILSKLEAMATSDYFERHSFPATQKLNLATPAAERRALALSNKVEDSSDSIDLLSSVSYSNLAWFEHNR